jgi:hypothetical protein
VFSPEPFVSNQLLSLAVGRQQAEITQASATAGGFNTFPSCCVLCAHASWSSQLSDIDGGAGVFLAVLGQSQRLQYAATVFL